MKKVIFVMAILSLLLLAGCKININSDLDSVNTKNSETNKTTVNSSVSKGEWASLKQNGDFYEFTYADGITDNYMINQECSFKNLTDWLDYLIPGYPREVFRHMVSLYYCNSDYFDQYIKESSKEQIYYNLSTLASLSWQIAHDTNNTGNVKSLRVDKNNSKIFVFKIEPQNDYSYNALHWDISNNTLKMESKDGKLIPYTTTTFDSNNIASYMVAIEEALSGTSVEDDK